MVSEVDEQIVQTQTQPEGIPQMPELNDNSKHLIKMARKRKSLARKAHSMGGFQHLEKRDTLENGYL